MAISTIGQNGLTVPLTSNTITSASATALTLQSAGTTAMTIDTSQNVGIGISNTAAKVNTLLSGTAISGNTTGSAIGSGNIFQLSSNNWSNTDSTVFLTGGGTSSTVGQISAGIGFSRQSNSDWGTQIRFYTHQTATDVLDTFNERMRIDASGVLAIGNTSGSAATRLVVYGSGSGSNTLAIFRNSNAATLVSLAENATSWAAGSDPRLKNITGTYTTPLADIAHIRPIKFTWKSDSTNAPQVGVDATTVEPVVPEAIGRTKLIEGDETEYLTVKYQELIPLMIASIQELKAINDQQAETINALTARIEALENK